MTEIQFLLGLLLGGELNESVRKALLERIGEVELSLSPIPQSVRHAPRMVQDPSAQSASTQAILDRNPDLVPVHNTGAAAKALADRQALVQKATAAPQPTGPRKF